MTRIAGRWTWLGLWGAILLESLGGRAVAEPAHGLAMYGAPALPPGFTQLPYANPDAPVGGKIVFGESGGFDSLNPYIQKGRAPWGMRAHVFETLLGRSYAEPFTMYGLLAETVETPDDRSWVEFTLRKEARFSNGDPVTVEDVIWSFETLGTQGSGRYRRSWDKIKTIEQTGARSLRITFAVEDRELPLIMGLRPILRKADWEGREFTRSGFDPIHGSGPYVVDSYEAGRQITFARNPDYWGWDLGFNAGRHNFETIKYEYFADGSVIHEAFKAGVLSVYREHNAVRWEEGYDFPAVTNGDVVQSLIPHQRPSGIRGFVMNTRNPLFADWRVRQAMIHAFNFEFINQTTNGGRLPRITSYFSNSVFGMQEGPATGLVAEMLEPFSDDLLPGTMEGYALPVGRVGVRDRKNLRAAAALLKEGGWVVDGGVLRNSEGAPFTFDMLLRNSALEEEAVSNIYSDALRSLGISMRLISVDKTQYKERTDTYDFDMTPYVRQLSLSPGNEQYFYWGAAGVDQPGTRNLMGMNSPAAEAMIERMLNARDQEEYVAAVRALDRVLTAGRYVIPIWHSTDAMIAHRAELRFPDALPIYGDWVGFLPDVWWQDP